MEENKATGSDVKKADDGVLKRVWDFFASLKLTVILLIVLAAVSIIGTVIDQTDPNKNLQMMIDLFGHDSAQGWLNLIIKLGLTNMYHSWWFVGLLMLLSSNLSVCTYERLPGVFNIIRKVQQPLTDESLKGLAIKKEIRIKGDMEALKGQARAAVKHAGFSPKEASEGGSFQYYAEKGRYSRLGVYVTHISVLIIFIGALIGSFWGYKGYVQIMENNSVDAISIINKPLLRNFGPEVPLGFKVRCDKFELKMYGSSQMPSDYLSTLTIVDNGKEMFTKTIRVNDPMQYKGIRFFQSSYGVMPGMATMTIRVTPKDGSPNIRDYMMKKDEKVHIEGTNYDMVIDQLAPDVAIGPNNQIMAQSDQFKGHGAAVMKFLDAHGDMVDQAVILNEAPDSQPSKMPFTLAIMNYKGPYYTGLQVTYDPGVWIVWTGCTLMVLGIMIAFFTYHKRVWIRLVQGEKGQVIITAAGSANKNRKAFEEDFGRMLDRLGAK